MRSFGSDPELPALLAGIGLAAHNRAFYLQRMRDDTRGLERLLVAAGASVNAGVRPSRE